ncbi:oxygen-independent coproporphyrinogen III oxidase [Sulfitobacter sp. HNIBRBA3233]|uniref:oxygen-independent coproporphyrinogen III oxidase n=1 Tax=Sulfitobacter marinivivus TaxID=3158558 RepID=UPI0032DEC638
MDKIDTLRDHGLFDAKVPRYTSYPPANHFREGIGPRYQAHWLDAVPQGSDISVYVHIPFCKRLCWFCACRTQGTQTMRPVEAYVATLIDELHRVRDQLPADLRMARLHLGGGTPTILTAPLMESLLDAMFAAFDRPEDFEFSVEIDPTEASAPLLDTLTDYGMNRASIGVQDFAPEVQRAIGRPQSFAQTRAVVDHLRARGLESLNLDLLYGLPLQTARSFGDTLGLVRQMSPDRLAIYGYAHVPWMSKRQVMIKDKDLPDAQTRFALSEQARAFFTGDGYDMIGIDHFARPDDSLARAARDGRLRRNFQGYTDDTAPTLVGLGASAISRFGEGYVQNAAATSAYQARIAAGGLAGHKGYRMRPQDSLVAAIIDDLMCRFALDERALAAAFPAQAAVLRDIVRGLLATFPGLFRIGPGGLHLEEDAHPLVRIIAHHVDSFAATGQAHSAAI